VSDSEKNVRLLDLRLKGKPRFEIFGDGSFAINGETETKPEVICQALKEIALGWADLIPIDPTAECLAHYTAILLDSDYK